jgi:general stress protein 26
MSQIEISYEDLKQHMIEELKKYHQGYLATSKDDFVTVRQMLLITNGLTIYCFTGTHSRKYKQIMANPQVAIAAGNLQIEGLASLKGQLLEEENTEFREVYRKTQPERYERSTRIHFPRPDTKLIEITPQKMTLYAPPNLEAGTEAQYDILNLVKGTAHRVGRSKLKESSAYQD